MLFTLLYINSNFFFLKIALLNPDDPMLKFITVREKDHLLPTRKRIVMFRTPEAQHIVCYDGKLLWNKLINYYFYYRYFN